MLEFESDPRRKYKVGITAGKILVLIRTRELDSHPEIPKAPVQNRDIWEHRQVKQERRVKMGELLLQRH